MTAALKDWLLSLTAAALALSLAQSLLPGGTIGRIGALIGGLVLLLTALDPLLGKDLPAWRETLAVTEIRQEEYLHLYETFIEEQIQAYHPKEGGS